MNKPAKKPVVNLIGKNGNPFAILGAVKAALKKSGADKAYIDQYLSEAMSGDYSNLLAVSMDYVEIR